MSATRAVRRPPAAGHRNTSRGVGGHVASLAVAMLGVAALVGATAASGAPGPVGLGTADSFAVLAGSGITNTGPTTITGDVGTFPTTSETGFETLTLIGTNHRGDAVTAGAKDDLDTAYADAAGRTPWTDTPVELGGSTLGPGVYRGGTFGLTGTLTLDAQGNPDAEFVFQAASTLITATNSRVLLRGGADPCHVVWQVGSSATFTTGTQFVGNVLAQTSITAETGATFRGRLLARDAAVTLDTNTITKANCLAAAPGAIPSTTAGPPAGPGATAAPHATSPATSPGATPPGAPGPTSPTAGGPVPPTGTPGVSSGPPDVSTGPPRERVSTPSTPPFLANTGLQAVALGGAGLALLALGVGAVLAGRRRRQECLPQDRTLGA